MENEFYVYGHFDLSGSCRYVGKGSKQRAWCWLQRNRRWDVVFREAKPTVVIFEGDLDENTAYEREGFYVKKYLEEGADLVNVAQGGRSGEDVWDERASKILSDDRKGEGSYWFGKKRGQLMKQLKAIQMEKCPKPWLGKKRDPELIAKMGAASRTPEAIEKRRQKMQGRKLTEEHKAAIRAKLKGRKLTAEHAAAISAAKRKKNAEGVCTSS